MHSNFDEHGTYTVLIYRNKIHDMHIYVNLNSSGGQNKSEFRSVTENLLLRGNSNTRDHVS